MSDCRLTPNHGQNKLIFNEMMIRSVLDQHTLMLDDSVLSKKNFKRFNQHQILFRLGHKRKNFFFKWLNLSNNCFISEGIL